MSGVSRDMMDFPNKAAVMQHVERLGQELLLRQQRIEQLEKDLFDRKRRDLYVPRREFALLEDQLRLAEAQRDLFHSELERTRSITQAQFRAALTSESNILSVEKGGGGNGSEAGKRVGTDGSGDGEAMEIRDLVASTMNRGGIGRLPMMTLSERLSGGSTMNRIRNVEDPDSSRVGKSLVTTGRESDSSIDDDSDSGRLRMTASGVESLKAENGKLAFDLASLEAKHEQLFLRYEETKLELAAKELLLREREAECEKARQLLRLKSSEVETLESLLMIERQRSAQLESKLESNRQYYEREVIEFLRR